MTSIENGQGSYLYGLYHANHVQSFPFIKTDIENVDIDITNSERVRIIITLDSPRRVHIVDLSLLVLQLVRKLAQLRDEPGRRWTKICTITCLTFKPIVVYDRLEHIYDFIEAKKRFVGRSLGIIRNSLILALHFLG